MEQCVSSKKEDYINHLDTMNKNLGDIKVQLEKYQVDSNLLLLDLITSFDPASIKMTENVESSRDRASKSITELNDCLQANLTDTSQLDENKNRPTIQDLKQAQDTNVIVENNYSISAKINKNSDEMDSQKDESGCKMPNKTLFNEGSNDFEISKNLNGMKEQFHSGENFNLLSYDVVNEAEEPESFEISKIVNEMVELIPNV